ncbi:MAG TPA: hypothetical protein VJN29_11530 [Intrasporangium sp.]|uniref:hypothetical protein n=1 Tax=Intrasporangium sp. TaxID=1925024 RepID=UPI002B45C6B6|nr:hypothetical protein [Intrasporangium sp.]HKX67847.1 hypothetical protein [Intrasporangium sp.]
MRMRVRRGREGDIISSDSGPAVAAAGTAPAAAARVWRRSRKRPGWLTLLTSAVVLWALARVQLGFDYGDGPHAVGLAMRLADGDRPFVDEMNLQVMGSWPAVPFVWLWMHTVGTDGIVLASRVYFVLLSLLVAHVSWRAIAPVVGRGTSAAVIAIAVIPAAYNLPVVSYNTTPALLLLLATCAIIAAVTRRVAAWAWVGGAALALGAAAHPVTVPTGLLLGVIGLVLLGRSRLALYLLGGAAGAAAVVLIALVTLWGGLDALRATIDFTVDYQSLRPSSGARLRHAVSAYRDSFGWLVPAAAVLCLVAALVPTARAGRSWRVWARTALFVVAGVLLTVAMLRGGLDGPSVVSWSWTSGFTATALVLVLAVPAAILAVRSGDRLSRRVLVLGLPPTLLGIPVIWAMTSASPAWGSTSAVLTPGMVGIFTVLLRDLSRGFKGAVGRPVRWPAAVLSGLVLVLLAASHTLTSYRTPPVADLRTRVTFGINAGLVNSEREVRILADKTRLARQCGRTALDYEQPTGHQLGEVRIVSPIIWLVRFEGANQVVVDWLTTRDAHPDCIFISTRTWPPSPGLLANDPLLRWIQERYVLVGEVDNLDLLRRADLPPAGPAP